ncbi:MAG: class I SAM-dependent methyltransferase [DPANN group archaeon]|nr:class I SAM-dependent methyltransferase [DPANN group archaeon]
MKIEEEYGLPEIYFSKVTAANYEKSRAMRKIQTEITRRALEFIKSTEGTALDIGCGTGFSMQVLADAGFDAVGVDVSQDMIDIAVSKGFKALHGTFMNLPFDNNSFDAAVSISALQWIQAKSESELIRNYLKVLTEIYRVLKPKGECVIQFYPINATYHDLFIKAVKKTPFTARTVTDFPNNQKKRKTFIVLEKR